VSRSGSERTGGEAFAALTAAVERALERIRELEGRVRDAESRSSELGAMLERFNADEEAPAQMVERLGRLEEENREMKRRLEAGRGAVDRLLARIRFLEEKV
jgi:predicted RNase H-like nuclease (RuvC/YqgF family)